MRHVNRARDEAGSATVLAALFVAVLAAVCVAGIWLGAAVIAVHRSQSAADLAALVAAARVPAGTAPACGQAASLAKAMGANLLSCRVTGLDATVVVAVRVGGRIGREARASARAGPVASG